MSASVARPPRAHRGKATDAQVLAAIAGGDLSALGELYDRYHDDVRRAVSRTLRRSADVDDVVHATFLQLPALAAGFDGGDRARAWLAGIAVRMALRHRRSLGRLLAAWTRFGESSPRVTERTPEQDAVYREELAIFEPAFDALSAKKRAAFVLVELEGLTAEEAGRALGIPSATVRTRLFSAKEELRAAMKRGGAW